jgi:hypothetical protein
MLEQAIDSLGIYPKAHVDEKGVRTERTERQEGWNEAIITIRKNHILIKKWYEEIPEEHQEIVKLFLEQDIAFISFNENRTVSFNLLMNDTFCYACADGEEVTINELSVVKEMYQTFGSSGLTAWVAIKRNEEPVRELRTSFYFAARDYLKDKFTDNFQIEEVPI